MSKPCNTRGMACGFTLVELVVGIVIMAIALTLMASLIFPQARHSVEPLQQMRAAELAQSLLNEIKAKAFDQNSDHSDGIWRCGETLAGQTIPQCTAEADFGPDAGETRSTYNDVDDYHSFDQFIIPTKSNGETLADLYPNFKVKISVVNDPSLIGGNGNNIAKRIDLAIQLPSAEMIRFSSYRWNY